MHWWIGNTTPHQKLYYRFSDETAPDFCAIFAGNVSNLNFTEIWIRIIRYVEHNLLPGATLSLHIHRNRPGEKGDSAISPHRCPTSQWPRPTSTIQLLQKQNIRLYNLPHLLPLQQWLTSRKYHLANHRHPLCKGVHCKRLECVSVWFQWVGSVRRRLHFPRTLRSQGFIVRG